MSKNQPNPIAIEELLTNNKIWAEKTIAAEPAFFEKLARQQTPQFLWIGCSDSRVPANQITGLLPGEIFVHRNVANVVVHSDLNCLSTVQFAVDFLHVRDIIVCGHYGCGGVMAALKDEKLGLIDNWLRHVQDVHAKHKAEIEALPDENARHRRLCELNVIEQVVNVCRSTVVRTAWERGQKLTVHGWVYDIHDGLIKNLSVSSGDENELMTRYNALFPRK